MIINRPIGKRRDYADVVCANPKCGVPLCSANDWRKGIRPSGRKPHKAKGLCPACYRRQSRHGDFELRVKNDRPKQQPGYAIWPADELLDEYVLIRSDVSSIREAAERMGITFSRLDKALYRARKRGDSRGNAPLTQIELAHQRGSSLPIARSQEAA